MCGKIILLLLVIALCASLGMCAVAASKVATCAVASTSGASSQAVTGTITLTQPASGDTMISISLSGFDTTDSDKMHGFHVHEMGNLGNACADAKGHYNPLNVNHGAPTAAVRHVGDLGNIMEDASGKVNKQITDSVVKLDGSNSVMGRAIVIHSTTDDFGLAGNSGSMTTGNAGGRLACCIITESAGATYRISLVLAFLPLLIAFLLQRQ